MKPMSMTLRKEVASDSWMEKCCIPNCSSTQVEWEHSWIYAGSQIGDTKKDWWAIVPMCQPHHRGDKQKFLWRGRYERTKLWGRWMSLCRANIGEISKQYPKFDWVHEKKRLDKLFLYNLHELPNRNKTSLGK